MPQLKSLVLQPLCWAWSGGRSPGNVGHAEPRSLYLTSPEILWRKHTHTLRIFTLHLPISRQKPWRFVSKSSTSINFHTRNIRSSLSVCAVSSSTTSTVGGMLPSVEPSRSSKPNDSKDSTEEFFVENQLYEMIEIYWNDCGAKTKPWPPCLATWINFIGQNSSTFHFTLQKLQKKLRKEITQAPHAYFAFASAASALALMTLASINQRVFLWNNVKKEKMWNIVKHFKDKKCLFYLALKNSGFPLPPAQLYTWEMALVAPASVKITGPTSRLRGFFTAFGRPWFQLLFWSHLCHKDIRDLQMPLHKNPHLILRLVHARRWDLKSQPRETRTSGGSFLSLKFRSQILSNESNLHVFHECHVHLLQCLCYRTAESWLGKIHAKKNISSARFRFVIPSQWISLCT